MGIEKLLGKIYYNPKEGFMGVNNLFKKAKAKDKTVKLVDVKKCVLKFGAILRIYYCCGV